MATSLVFSMYRPTFGTSLSSSGFFQWQSASFTYNFQFNVTNSEAECKRRNRSYVDFTQFFLAACNAFKCRLLPTRDLTSWPKHFQLNGYVSRHHFSSRIRVFYHGRAYKSVITFLSCCNWLVLSLLHLWEIFNPPASCPTWNLETQHST